MALLGRRSLLALGAASSLAPVPGRAQIALPDKAVYVLVGFAPTGSIDQIARWISLKLERRIGRHVSVENKPGSGGALPGDMLKRGPTDGSLLAFMPSTTLISRLAQKDFPFDPLVDLAPITLVGTYQLGFAVSPKIKVGTIAEYLDWVKAGDESRKRVGSSTGSDTFIEIENRLFDQATGVNLKTVQMRGAAPLVKDLQEGVIPAGVAAVTSLLEHHRGGRVRILMTTGEKRLAVARDIPTARQAGYPQLEMDEWFAFFASAATPPEVLQTWNDQIRFVLSDPEVKAEMTQLGLGVEATTLEESRARVRAHRKEWQARLETVGMKPLN
ncbi:MAG TPA: tripartite tricarboxylate transporter substrate-binding protein [Reyranella sp.]|nr:tripartite tricarboxylate transporter substrate-binding protein [Reyranella sp.]